VREPASAHGRPLVHDPLAFRTIRRDLPTAGVDRPGPRERARTGERRLDATQSAACELTLDAA
jgi:hypothetical protein